MNEDILLSKARETLKRTFGYSTFRAGQENIIASILKKQDTVGIMPTGQGKSLCYQVPALMMNGSALVISPLIALMKDQEDELKKISYPSSTINSTSTGSEIERTFSELHKKKLKLLYLSPERLANERFIAQIKHANISFIAIDEAHCISEWGHDFRPDYQTIYQKLCLITIPPPPILALTATATPQVVKDITNSLSLRTPYIYIGGFRRTNLSLSIFKLADKYTKILNILKGVQGASIIYANTRQEVEKTSSYLNQVGIQSRAYHAGLEDKERRNAQDSFHRDDYRVICATSAFGMGINKKNIRSVIHASPPSSIDEYYQQAGRAGRDGIKSYAILLFNEKDFSNLRRRIESGFPEKKLIDKIIKSFVSLLGNQPRKAITLSQDIFYKTLINNISKSTKYSIKNALSFMSKQGFISFTAHDSVDKIRFLVAQQSLENHTKHHAEKELTNALLRELGTEPFTWQVRFSLEKMCQKHSLDSPAVSQILKTWKNKNLIEFESKNSVTISIQNIPSSQDFSSLKAKRKRALSKLNAISLYLHTKSCKMSWILKYFGDKDYYSPCSICDYCLSSKKKLDI